MKRLTLNMLRWNSAYLAAYLMAFAWAATPVQAAGPELVWREDTLNSIDAVELFRNGLYWWTSASGTCGEISTAGGASYRAYSDARLVSAAARLNATTAGLKGGFNSGDLYEGATVLGGRPSQPRGALLANCLYGAYFVRDDEAFYYAKSGQLYRKPLTYSADAEGDPYRFLIGTHFVSMSANGALLVTDQEIWSYSADPQRNTLTINHHNKKGGSPLALATLPGISIRKCTIADVISLDGNPAGSFFIALLPDGRLYRVSLAGQADLLADGVSDFAIRNEQNTVRQGPLRLPIIQHTTRLYAALGHPITHTGASQLLAKSLTAGGAADYSEFDGGAFQVTSVAVDGSRIFLTRSPSGSGIANSDLLRRNAPAVPTLLNLGDPDYQTIAVQREFRSLRSSGSWVYFADGNTVQRISSDAPPMLLDFQALGLEVTQGIQTLNNSVTLVANKPAVVRGYAQIRQNNTRLSNFDIPARLRVSSVVAGGPPQEVPGSPFLPVQTPALTLSPSLAKLRGDLNTTFQFEIPAAVLVPGVMQFEFTINPGRTVPETGADPLANNTWTASLTSVPTATPNLVFVVMSSGLGNYDPRAANSGFWDIIQRAKTMLPLADVKVYIRDGSITKPVLTFLGIKGRSFNIPGDESDAIFWLSAARVLDNLFEDQPDNAYYVGMFPPGQPSLNGQGQMPGHALILRMGSESLTNTPYNSPYGGRTLAHEFSHNLGRKHINSDKSCGGVPAGPFDTIPNATSTCNMGPTDLNQADTPVGFDLFSWSVVTPSSNGDLMSYAATRWPSAFDWTANLDALKSRAPQFAERRSRARALPAGTESLLIVHAAFDPLANTGQFWPGFVMPSGTLSSGMVDELTSLPAGIPVDAPLRLKVLDAGGSVLVDQAAPTRLLTDSDRQLIQCGLPFPDGASRIQLVNNGVVLAELLISAQAPTVQVALPVLADGKLKISWTAADGDGDTLYFTVQLSNDDGHTWRSLTVNYPESEYDLDATFLPGGDKVRVRVIATDGVLTAIDTSEPVVLPKQDPSAQIVGVQDGDIFEFGRALSASGFGYDPEDGSLAPGALQWNLAGPVGRVGTGNTFSLSALPPGTYKLTLTATDSDGQKGSCLIQFTVRGLAIAEGDEPILDGLCADAAYQKTPPLQIPGGGSYASAHFAHANNAMFVCLTGLAYGTAGAAASAGVRLDTAGTGAAGGNVAGFAVDENGGIYRMTGDGTKLNFILDAPSGFSVVILRDDNFWSAEMRITDDLLGGWNHHLGVVVVTDDGDGSTPPGTWPPGTDVNNPAVWSLNQAGPLPPLASDGNLLPYGDLENIAGGDGSAIVPLPGWNNSGAVTVVRWGAPGGFPLGTDPGPENRGLNFIAGGPQAAQSSATTTVVLPVSADKIDGGEVTAELSGWLGGFSSQEDSVTLTAAFLNGAGATVGTLALGPVTAEDRQGATGLLYRSAVMRVPAEARTVLASLVFNSPEGNYNDGYADNLSLTLREGPLPTAPNLAPIANAGPTQTISVSVGDSVTLDGSASSDPEGSPLSYIWREVQGPAFSISGASTAKPTLIVPSIGKDTTAIFELVVSDGVQESAPSQTVYTLQPRSSAGPVQITSQLYESTAFVLRAIVPPGGSAVLERAPEVLGAWIDVGQPQTGSGAEMELRDDNPPATGAAFYRIRYTP